MAIIKNEIPILEYDTNSRAVIMPDHEHLDIRLPEKAVFAFLGEEIDRYALEHHAVKAAVFVSITKEYPIYLTEYQGQQICLVQAPTGASAAVQILDWLISYGVKQVITAGSCGVLTDIEENMFLIPGEALRDEGTSYHYAPPSRFIDIHPAAQRAIAEALEQRGLKYREVVTWSTDGFFRETRDKVLYRMSEGCEVVEMECSALAACAAMRGIVWGELLFSADTLANLNRYEERNWGMDSVAAALEICLDAVVRL